MCVQLGLKQHEYVNLSLPDLRPKNIYISEEGKFKIGDFGLATDKKLSKKR